MGHSTLDVRRRLTEAGLTPDSHTLPDHVGIELAFMSHLAAREARAWDDGDEATARDYLLQQGDFVRQHLAVWLPQFCRRVLVGRPHAHYADLTRRLNAFVADDTARMRAWLGENGKGIGTVVQRQWWDVTLDPGCTLCEICAQMCQPGALQAARKDGEVVLRFKAACCDGCAACQRWCPEKLIRVAPANERPSSQPVRLARSAMLACPRCGQLHAPAAMINRVQAQVGVAGNETLTQRLALCRDCKVLGG